jgi:chemotaxis protein MotB
MRNMKMYQLTMVVGLGLLYACAPIYTCGDEIPTEPVMGGKRLKTVVAERDVICADLASSEESNVTLNEQVNNVTDKNVKLQEKYNELLNRTSSQTMELNEVLQSTNEKLNKREIQLMEREQTLNDMRRLLARKDSTTANLNNVLRSALFGFTSDELSIEIKDGKVYVSMSDNLLFKSGSADVESKGKDAIKVLAEVLSKNKDIDILVEGHTDNVPIKTTVFKDNWDLSVGRATSIVRLLTSTYKIQSKRITASGRGEFVPKESNDTEAGRAKNRRTEIILSPKLDEIMKIINR